MQRATGELRVSVKRRGDESVLDGLRQAGCLKARFPRAVAPGWFDATMVNTSGGVAGGDRLESVFSAGEGARITIAAQAAERFYRALPDSTPSRVRTSISVAPGAAAEWLPQETILFDRCALDRRLAIDVAPGAWFLGVEMLVFGRAAMGERVVTARLRDQIQVRRGGVPLLRDAIRLEGEVDSVLERPAIADGARALATLVYVAPDAEARLDAVRASADIAASAWNGMLIARILAPDGALARRTVMAALAVLRDGRPLPRAWLC
ncbi:MAG: urease accessory protein UreD [Acetobacteraceae bacterium]|nr:urease accessory protein UreD [Acetobacteraceae bacterium]